MNCWNCGNELRDGDVFCSKCGVAVGNTQNYSGQLSGFSSDGMEKDAAIFENVRKDPNPAVWNENYSDGWGGGLSVPDNRKNVGNPSGKKKLFIALVAVFVILVLIGLIIFGVSFWRHSAGNNGPAAGQGKTEKTEKTEKDM